MQTTSMICSRVRRAISFGRYWAKPRAPDPRGTMVTFKRGSACSRYHPATAWPASWKATMRFSSSVMIFDDSKPPMTRSAAASKSEKSTFSLSRRAATMAASLQTFSISAPAKPGVKPAKRDAKSSTGPSRVRPLKWTLKMALRPWMSGFSTKIWRSKRPGLVNALSKTSTRFVPAKTTTFVDSVKPSISTKSWFRVFSRSSLPPAKPPRPRCLPTASISSMKMIHGAFARASLKRSLTREGPTPTNISTNSEPLIE
mmetsp:Transcript_15381/g.50314  ORF Transcript_15381/g.50314 Transcript_15381/m.50314 type:complete len:257 (-) Transcript_15381:592-1362(-)